MLKKLIFGLLLLCSLAAQAVVYSLPWGPRPQFVDANGAPMSSGTLTFYAAGTTTPQNTYTDSTGGVANSNPITLNTRGETPNEVWFTGGASYKMILKDSSGSTVWTVDNISGINDVSSQLGLEWIASGLTPTFVSVTSFTLVGDQTLTLHVGRRLKTVNSGGTIYSTITASAFAGVTTVTVANDSGTLDAGLSSVSYGLVSANNPSTSPQMVYRKGTAVASAATTNIWNVVGDYIHITGVAGITSLGTAPYAGAERTIVFDGVLTLTHNAATLILPGAANITTAVNDRMVVRADTTANMIVTQYSPASGAAVASSPPRSYLAGCTMSAAGSSATLTTAACQATDSGNTNTITLSSSLAKTTGAWAVGAAQGCLDTGAIANTTWYHWYVINRPDTSVTDVLCSTNASAPTMPTNYTLKRRIGASLTDGAAQWVKFIQINDLFEWDVPVTDVNTTNPGTSAILSTLKVPLGVSVQAWFEGFMNNVTSTNAAVLFTDPAQTDTAPVYGTLQSFSTIDNAANRNASGDFYTVTNTSSQIRYRLSVSGAADVVKITTKGWIDSRGKNN